MVVREIAMVVRETPMAIATEAKLLGKTTTLTIMITIVIEISTVVVVKEKEKEKISMVAVPMAVHTVAVTTILVSVTKITVIHNPKIKHQIVSLTLIWVVHRKQTTMIGDQGPGLDLDRVAAMGQILAAMEANKIL